MSANQVNLNEEPCVRAVLVLLLAHRDCVALRGRDPREGAVGWPLLQGVAGADAACLRSLLRAGLVEAVGGPTADRELRPHSRFLLTEAGLCQARKAADVPDGPRLAGRPRRKPPAPGEKPRWDPAARELWFAGEVVLRFPRGARNQEGVLTAFQELAWPLVIDDPLPPEEGVHPVTRLRDTVRHLNARLGVASLLFRADAAGRAVYWSASGD